MQIRSIVLPLVATLVSACGGGDGGNPIGPDSECDQGSVTPGTVKTGTLTATDCTFSPASRSDGFYDAYSVSLGAGRVYQVRLDAQNQGSLDAFVEVVAPGGVVVALSDDNIFSPQSELFFVAPVRGTYSVRAGGQDESDLGDYTLSVRDCAATTITTTEAISASLSVADCVTRYSLPLLGNASDVFLVPFSSAALDITVSSTAVTPLFTVGGPDLASLEADFVGFSTLGDRLPAKLTIPAGEPPGTYLVIVSAQQTVDADRAYTIQVAPAFGTGSARREGGWPAPGQFRFDRRGQ